MPATYETAPHGSELAWAKLNETLVRIIRAEHAAKEAEKKRLDAEYSAQAIARRYHVHPRTVEKVLAYETWRHVL